MNQQGKTGADACKCVVTGYDGRVMNISASGNSTVSVSAQGFSAGAWNRYYFFIDC